jgi:hypothetical protein
MVYVMPDCMRQRSGSVSGLIASSSSEAATEGVVGSVEGSRAAGLSDLRLGGELCGAASWGDVSLLLRDRLGGDDEVSSSSAPRFLDVGVIIAVVMQSYATLSWLFGQ